MATSADDLLGEAHRELQRSARSLPVRGPLSGRPAAAHEAAAASAAAWPRLAAAQASTLRAAPVGPGRQAQLEPVLTRLDRVARQDPPPGIEPDPHLVRAVDLTSAAADALRSTAPPPGFTRDATGTIDQVLSSIETAATLTAVYAEWVPEPSNRPRSSEGLPADSAQPARWRDLAHVAYASRTTLDPRQRTSEAGEVPILSSRDTGLAAVLERWRRAAHQASQLTVAPTRDVPLVAAGLWQIHGVAHDAGIAGSRPAAAAWQAVAVRGWGVTNRIPGPVDQQLRDAAAQLRLELREHGSSLATGQGPEADALGQFVRAHSESTAELHQQQIQSVVQSQQIIVPARALLASLPRPYDPALAEAAHKRRWVALPPESPIATTLLDATNAAASATTDAALIARTRQMHEHSFPADRGYAPGDPPSLGRGSAARNVQDRDVTRGYSR
ncbi:hypothetical protein [Calidifontibacter terrae]